MVDTRVEELRLYSFSSPPMSGLGLPTKATDPMSFDLLEASCGLSVEDTVVVVPFTAIASVDVSPSSTHNASLYFFYAVPYGQERPFLSCHISLNFFRNCRSNRRWIPSERFYLVLSKIRALLLWQSLPLPQPLNEIIF
eukprot:m.61745 g.61745  ORF g.61745 m.61745 type:complete len:139 (-) comp11400_c1_seq2:40-456(-)